MKVYPPEGRRRCWWVGSDDGTVWATGRTQQEAESLLLKRLDARAKKNEDYELVQMAYAAAINDMAR